MSSAHLFFSTTRTRCVLGKTFLSSSATMRPTYDPPTTTQFLRAAGGEAEDDMADEVKVRASCARRGNAAALINTSKVRARGRRLMQRTKKEGRRQRRGRSHQIRSGSAPVAISDRLFLLLRRKRPLVAANCGDPLRYLIASCGLMLRSLGDGGAPRATRRQHERRHHASPEHTCCDLPISSVSRSRPSSTEQLSSPRGELSRETGD